MLTRDLKKSNDNLVVHGKLIINFSVEPQRPHPNQNGLQRQQAQTSTSSGLVPQVAAPSPQTQPGLATSIRPLPPHQIRSLNQRPRRPPCRPVPLTPLNGAPTNPARTVPPLVLTSAPLRTARADYPLAGNGVRTTWDGRTMWITIRAPRPGSRPAANYNEHAQRSQREANMQLERRAHQSRMLPEDRTGASSPNLPDAQQIPTPPPGPNAGTCRKWSAGRV